MKKGEGRITERKSASRGERTAVRIRKSGGGSVFFTGWAGWGIYFFFILPVVGNIYFLRFFLNIVSRCLFCWFLVGGFSFSFSLSWIGGGFGWVGGVTKITTTVRVSGQRLSRKERHILSYCIYYSHVSHGGHNTICWEVWGMGVWGVRGRKGASTSACILLNRRIRLKMVNTGRTNTDK